MISHHFGRNRFNLKQTCLCTEALNCQQNVLIDSKSCQQSVITPLLHFGILNPIQQMDWSVWYLFQLIMSFPSAVQHERGPRSSTMRKHMVLYMKDSSYTQQQPDAATHPPPHMKYVPPPPQLSPAYCAGCVAEDHHHHQQARMNRIPTNQCLCQPASVCCSTAKQDSRLQPMSRVR